MNTNTLKKKNVTFPVFIYIIISIHSEDFSQLQLWVCLSVCNIFDTPFKSANNRTMDYGTTYHVLRTKVSNMVSNSGMQECRNAGMRYYVPRFLIRSLIRECGNTGYAGIPELRTTYYVPRFLIRSLIQACGNAEMRYYVPKFIKYLI